MDLFADPVGESVEFLAEVILGSRGFSELDDQGIVHIDPAEARAVGAHGVREHEGVLAVVLCTSDGMTITKPIKLLRVDGEDVEAALDETLDQSTAWNLDRHGDPIRMTTRKACEPIEKLVDAAARVMDRSLRDDFPRRAESAHLMRVDGPVDPGEDIVFVLHQAPPCVGIPTNRGASPPLYWRSKRNSPLGVQRGHPTGAQVPPRSCKAQGAVWRSRMGGRDASKLRSGGTNEQPASPRSRPSAHLRGYRGVMSG